jgi:phosphatidylglycerophosphate synthase
VSEALAKARLPLRLLAGAFGISLFAYLVHRAGPDKLVESMSTLRWGLVLVIAWGGVAHVVKTWAWRITLLHEKHQVSFARMLGLRLASEAVGQLGGFAQLFGEGLRVSLLGPAMPLASGITSVTLDRALFVLSAAVVSIVGLLAVLIILPLPHALALYGGLSVCTLFGFVLLSLIAVKKRWRVLSATAHLLGRFRYFKSWTERECSLIQSVENNLLAFYHLTPGSFWASFALNLACHVAAVFEVFVILWLLGTKVSLFGALAVEALTKLVNIVGTFNPGNIGTYEGGNMLIVKMFGLSAATGLTLAFVRRTRALFWAGVGGLCLAVLAKPKKRSGPVEGSSRFESDEEIMKIESAAGESPISSKPVIHFHTAIILANNLGAFGFTSPMPRVGALPVLLRTILGAQKAGAARIVVVIDRSKSPDIQEELLQTGRLPRNLEWCDFDSKEASLPSLLGQLTSEVDGHIVLIAGDSVYQPSLLKRAAEWDGESGALALTNGGEFIGICALSREIAINLSYRSSSGACSIADLHPWPTSRNSIEFEPVPEDKWQRVLSEQQRVSAERKLDGWLVKPTDGIFARMNRRISIPMSRQIIKFPITPNMVSLFTLGVSFAAGVFFAFGGYLSMLVGAVLSVWASILDGSDGEVARLKLQESDFGCWLETICDYLSYLFTFAGITIGLWRSSGTRTYLAWGSLFVFGAVLSFIVIGFQRRRLVGRPEQYLSVWHSQADSRRWNPLLYIGRHTEFIIRRCFLPYALLFFAVFNILKVAFVMSAVGVNLVWIIALYSCYAFAATHTTRVAESAATA